MIKVLGINIDENIFKVKFSCDYEHCKGGCCWVADEDADGGLLTDDEAEELDKKYLLMQKFMERTYKKPYIINKYGIHTSLCKDGGCVFSNMKGGLCAIRLAHKAGLVNFPIPVHCSLYPLGFENNVLYIMDTWKEICGPAYEKGCRENMPAFRFVKDSIIRLLGEDFYSGIDKYYKENYE